jgi:hypothetical protein
VNPKSRGASMIALAAKFLDLAVVTLIFTAFT